MIDDLRSRRNRSGGYWIAKDDPAAAQHAVTGSADLAGLDAVLVLSNGVSRLVDPYATASWPGLARMARLHGPDVVLAEVRAAEERLRPCGRARRRDDRRLHPQLRRSFQLAGTRSRGAGGSCSAGRLVGGARAGPRTATSRA